VTDETALRDAVRSAEERFEAGDRAGALSGLEAVRCTAPVGSRIWAEAVADLAVVLHAGGELPDAYAHARHALRAAPDLEEARETAAICAGSLGGLGAGSPADRVLIVVERFHPSVGGTETLAADLAVELTRRGRPADVLCYADPQRRPGWRGITVHETPQHAAGHALVRLLGTGEFGAVIGISAPTGFPVLGVLRLPHPLPAIRSLVVPCVNEQGYAQMHASPEILREYGRALLRVDAVGFSSRGGWDRRLLGDLGVPGVYLANAVPAVEPTSGFRQSIGADPGRPVILHVANLWPEKNHLGFLDELRGAPGDWRLASIGGPSAEYPQLEAEIAAAAARDPRVLLLGARSREEVAGAMAESDILVLPSIAEATPLVLLEAMSKGLPWLASETCGSASDLAGGLTVAQGGFAEAIARLLSSPAARAELGRSGRVRYAAEFSWDAVAPRYLEALADPAWANAA
jgi:glycosyltransferase involved in cell wall biosynthesis